MSDDSEELRRIERNVEEKLREASKELQRIERLEQDSQKSYRPPGNSTTDAPPPKPRPNDED